MFYKFAVVCSLYPSHSRYISVVNTCIIPRNIDLRTAWVRPFVRPYVVNSILENAKSYGFKACNILTIRIGLVVPYILENGTLRYWAYETSASHQFKIKGGILTLHLISENYL